MAVVAGTRGLDMCGRLAGCHGTVVAGSASSRGLGSVDKLGSRPTLIGVALIASSPCGDVIDWFRGSGCASAAHMTIIALGGGAGENPSDMTAFAG